MIRLVQNDTAPQLVVQLTDEDTGGPLDMTGATVILEFRAAGSTTIKDTLVGGLLPGTVIDCHGTVDLASYPVVGSGGRAAFDWNTTTLDTTGQFEGQAKVTFPDGRVQTVYELLKFLVRPDF